jgi:hypothetical protein
MIIVSVCPGFVLVVKEHPEGWRLRILPLTLSQTPDEPAQEYQGNQEAGGNKKNENAHQFSLFVREG